MHGLIGSKVESQGRHGRSKLVLLDVDPYEIYPAIYGHLQPRYRPDLLPLFERRSDEPLQNPRVDDAA